MKKLLLFLLCTISAILPSFAETVTFDFINEAYGLTRRSGTTSEYDNVGTTISSDGVQIVFKNTGATTGSSGIRLWSNGLRFYNKSYIEISGPEGSRITKVVAKTNSTTYVSDFGSTSATTSNLKNGTWEGSESVFNLYYTLTSSNKPIGILEVTYDAEGQSGPKTGTASFPQTSYTAYLDEAFDSPALTTNNTAGNVTYSSNNESVATVDNGGKVTPLAVGTTTITAVVAATEDYTEATASYILTVKAPKDPNDIKVENLTYSSFGLTSGNTSYGKYEYVNDELGLTYSGKVMYGKEGIQVNTGSNTGKGAYNGGITTTRNDNNYVIDHIEIGTTEAVSDKLKVDMSNTLGVCVAGNEKGQGVSLENATGITGSFSGTTAIFTPNKDFTSFRIYTNGSAVYITSLSVYYRKAVPTAAEPKIEFDEATGMVTITSDDKDAEIYYTTENIVLSKETGKEYSGPFKLTESCTVSAIAYVEGKKESEIATKKIELTSVFDNIAAVYGATVGSKVVVNANMSILAVNGKGAIVTDGKRNIYLYGNEGFAVAKGAPIDSFSGVIEIYNESTYEVKNATVNPGGDGVKVEPIEIVAAELKEVDCADNYDYVVLKHVALGNGKVSNGEDCYDLYNLLGAPEIIEADDCDVIGFVCEDGQSGSIQIIPVEIVKHVDTTKLGALTVNGKEVADEDELYFELGTTITFAAANAEMLTIDVYKEIENDYEEVVNDGVEGSSYEWTPTVAGNYNVEISYEGCDEENKCEFTIVITEPVYNGDVRADFVFMGENVNIVSMTDEYELVASTNQAKDPRDKNDLTNVTLTHPYNVTLKFEVTETENHPRFWLNGENTDVRFYEKNKITFTSDYPIKEIIFTKGLKSGFSLAEDGTELGEINTTNKTWTAKSEDVRSVAFKATGSNYIGTIRVVYYGPMPKAEVVAFHHEEPQVGDTDFSINYTLHVNHHHADRDSYVVRINLYRKGESAIYTYADFADHTVAQRAMQRRAISVNPSAEVDATHQLSGTASFTNLPAGQEFTATAQIKVNDGDFSDELPVKSDIALSITEVGTNIEGAEQWYDISGRRVANPANGLYIKKHGNTVTKHVL